VGREHAFPGLWQFIGIYIYCLLESVLEYGCSNRYIQGLILIDGPGRVAQALIPARNKLQQAATRCNKLIYSRTDSNKRFRQSGESAHSCGNTLCARAPASRCAARRRLLNVCLLAGGAAPRLLRACCSLLQLVARRGAAASAACSLAPSKYLLAFSSSKCLLAVGGKVRVLLRRGICGAGVAPVIIAQVVFFSLFFLVVPHLDSAVWCCLVLSGVVWCCLVLSGVVWCCVVLSGVAWCCLVLSGVAWCCLVLSGGCCLVLSGGYCLVLSGLVWRVLSLSSCVPQGLADCVLVFS